MSWLASIFVAILSGALGLFAAGFVANACAGWYRISGFEGKSGYFVVFNALLGGMLAFAAGLVISRIVAAMAAQGSSAVPVFFKALGSSSALVLAVCGALALVAWLLADIPPEIDGQRLTLEIELRLPPGQKPPPPPGEPTSENAEERAGHSFTLGSTIDHVQRSSQTGEIDLARARLENGRWIVPASVFLFTSRGLRSISIKLAGNTAGGFIVPLPARPGPADEQWSEWGPRGVSAAEPWPESKPSYRFRVARIVPPPPGPSVEKVEAEAAAREQAVFDALRPDAPLAEWFPYTRYGAPDDRRAIAIRNLTGKPDYVRELAALMIDPDARTASEALYLVEHIPQPTPALTSAVTAAGRHIGDALRTVNATTVEQDPGFDGAADISIRFHGWMTATRTLRAKNLGDFVPELRVILELSRVRTDSYVLQQDVRRISSYYANEWAGIAPQPGDPPPK